MYVCTYVRTYVGMYVCMYVHTYVRRYVCMYVCMYVRTYVRTYVHMYLCDGGIDNSSSSIFATLQQLLSSSVSSCSLFFLMGSNVAFATYIHMHIHVHACMQNIMH